MTAIGAITPMAAMAQSTDDDTAANVVGCFPQPCLEIVQSAETSADDNVQVNDADVKQSIKNSAECDDQCGASFAGRDDMSDQEQFPRIVQENEIGTGDASNSATDAEQENEFEGNFIIIVPDVFI